MARQRLGQHLVSDAEWREQIARAIRVSPHSTLPHACVSSSANCCWLEVGAGHGEMTEQLAAAGAPVYAVELDASLTGGLQRLAKKLTNVTVIPGDILEIDVGAIAAGRRVRVYGSLPYYITSPILHRLFSFADLIDEIDIVIQTEVARRLSAEPGNRDYGYLSVATQLYTRPEFVFEIPRAAFSPAPEVTSALVILRLPGERARLFPSGRLGAGVSKHTDRCANGETRFLNFAKLCFSQKRKTLANNLRSFAKPAAAREALSSLGLRPDARAEQLSVSELASLYARLNPV